MLLLLLLLLLMGESIVPLRALNPRERLLPLSGAAASSRRRHLSPLQQGRKTGGPPLQEAPRCAGDAERAKDPTAAVASRAAAAAAAALGSVSSLSRHSAGPAAVMSACCVVSFPCVSPLGLLSYLFRP